MFSSGHPNVSNIIFIVELCSVSGNMLLFMWNCVQYVQEELLLLLFYPYKKNLFYSYRNTKHYNHCNNLAIIPNMIQLELTKFLL